MNDAAIRVLLVEDNPSDVKTLLRILHTFQRATSVSIECVDRVSLALEHLQKNKVDIILTDMELPDSHGIETVIRLLNVAETIPVVAMTGTYMEEELALDAVRHGAQDYLFKDKLDGELLMRVIHFAISRKQMEVALKDLTSELKRSNDDLMQFAHTVAHDLKQPLRTLTHFIRDLSRRSTGRVDPEADRDCFLVIRSIEHMSAIIDDLLIYAKVGSGGLNIQSVSMEDALQTALENLNRVIKESQVLVTHTPLPTLLCDGTQVVCLLQNLIDNAIKFRGSAQPRIQISAAVSDTEIVFSVRDNGIGIDPKFHGAVFEILQRLHTQSEYPGTGMGLAICKKIVERHKGRIWVDSRHGEETTFYFTLLAQDHPLTL